jgi:hypothetical protein
MLSKWKEQLFASVPFITRTSIVLGGVLILFLLGWKRGSKEQDVQSTEKIHTQVFPLGYPELLQPDFCKALSDDSILELSLYMRDFKEFYLLKQKGKMQAGIQEEL